jgi:hypothetical protein
MQVLIWFNHLLVFVDAGEIFVMADDVATPSNLPVAPVEHEEFEEVPLDMNVFQRPHEEELSRQVVCTRIDHLAWDRRLSPNSHALAIYLEFAPIRGAALERFKECQCEDDDVHLHYQTWVPDVAIIVGYEA